MDDWSVSLKEQTRDAVEGRGNFVPFEDVVRFKCVDGAFGTMDAHDFSFGVLRLRNLHTNDEKMFANADELLAEGWVLD